jgi:hypothetical protein
MGHPSIVNETPFAANLLFTINRDGYPVCAPIVKGTFSIVPQVVPAEVQLPIDFVGTHYGPPHGSSIQLEADAAYHKPATDVVLLGHAYSRRDNDTQVDVQFNAGRLTKTVRVFGDRVFEKRLGMVTLSPPQTFDHIPLQYERAFGGWDSPTPDPFTSRFEPRNPVGVGFKRKHFEDGEAVPNLEDPKQLLKSYGDTPPPAGFGFIGPDWLPRSQYAGTYDANWENERAPLLPLDFDERFFNSAASGLVSEEPFQGNEEFFISGVSRTGPIHFKLPGLRPPHVRIVLRARPDQFVKMLLDTIIVDADSPCLITIWRGFIVLRNGPHDVRRVVVNHDGNT